MSDVDSYLSTEAWVEWAQAAEMVAAEAVDPSEWARHKEAVATKIQDEDFQGLSFREAGAKLVDAYKAVKADAVEAGRREQADAIVREAKSWYPNWIRGR